MYNIHVDNSKSINKGTFNLEFNPPIEFNENDKLALTNLSMYNSIYNISEYYPNNKFIFIKQMEPSLMVLQQLKHKMVLIIYILLLFQMGNMV